MLVLYNLVISGINVYCFLGFLSGMVRAKSFFDKEHDPELQKIYYLYWLTKVRQVALEMYDSRCVDGRN